MSLLFIAPNRNMQRWKDALLNEDPNIDIDTWPAIEQKEKVQFAVCWNHPSHLIDSFPNLKAVSSLGAGADHLLSDESLPPSVDICRIVSSSLIEQMKEYILNAILNYQRNTYVYLEQMKQNTWQEHANKPAVDIPIGVMGLGALGGPIARQLADFGYDVYGWSNSSKNIDGVTDYAGPNMLDEFLSRSRILVCLLPLTNETRGILDLDLFKKLNHPGYLINVARGEHLVEEDLIYALDKGWLDGACLDVFSEEPLPEKHTFWNRKNIIITPHVSSITRPNEVAEQIVENYKRALSGMPLLNTVSRQQGY